MFHSIKFFITKFQGRSDVSLKLQEQKIKASWQDVVSSIEENARGKSKVVYLKEDGELVVGVVNNMWMQEFSFRKEDIKKELQKQTNSVKSIRFVAAAEKQKHPLGYV